jgi:hypothetical protein
MKHDAYLEADVPFSAIDADNGQKNLRHQAAPLAGRALRALTDSTPPREPEGEPIYVGGTNLHAANDGKPAYIRMPYMDKRVASGDLANANCWLETATGRTRYFSVLYQADKGRWLPVVERTR